MSSKDEGKKFWVWGQIEEDTHTALLEISTMTGKHPRQLVEMGIDLVITHFVSMQATKGQPVPSTARLQALVTEDRTNQLRLNQVKMMAYNHIQNPTDETAERLAEACDLAGTSVELVLEQVSSTPHVIEIMNEGGGSLNNVESFLAHLMIPGKMYSAKEIIQAGENKGFKKYLINDAKRKLGIRSKRDKSEWVWYLPIKDTAHRNGGKSGSEIETEEHEF